MKKFKNRNGSDVFKQSILGIEQYYEQVQKGALSNHASLSPDKLGQDIPYEVIRKYFKFLYVQYQAKYAELTGAFIESVNNKEYLLFGLCGRSLLELTATLRYYIKKFEPIVNEAVKSGIFTPDQQKLMLDILDSCVRGGRFNWNEFYLGDKDQLVKHLMETKRKKGRSNIKQNSTTVLNKITPEQVNVLTTIEQWAKDTPEVLLVYEYFCELVHPNLGSNLLVIGAKAGQIVVGKYSSKNVAKNLCVEGIAMIASTAIREGARYMAALVLLKEMGSPPTHEIDNH